ncbi:putative lipopolysaccharide biosynthesis protein [Lunatimonas lonarensis]|uniref:Putative lipopolysaccharide biosynthesis protein n=1 Tax=Lunatimonas lonarensis TaxID=1232681 RepID=R7ZTX9_9BACT|nr:lipopolysaccharide biosynthesis protein [Lunatimonas lonarensis]EON77503.1 putative lipopolysaccharide biosynthesis protein [Lunatimonas lonarensis]
MSTETRQIISGVKWTSIQFALNTLFKFGVKLLLAKLLLPDDFGLVGMTSIFIAIAEAASELGMGAALIQKSSDEEAVPLYSTAYWSGLVWGLGLYLIMALIVGPFAASFYEEPSLKVLLPVLSIGVLIKPLNLIHTVILTRKMDFKKLALINNLSALIAGVLGLSLAFLGFGIWSLVINNVLAILLSVPMLFYITKWKPLFEWNASYFREIFGFGAFSTGTVIFGTITYNVDNLLIGKFLGAKMLGSYTVAFALTEQLRMTISSILNKVMFPVFGKNQKNTELLGKYFLNILNINAIFIYPIMGFLFLFSEVLILGFFGEEWVDAIVPLKLLSVAVMVHLIVNSFAAIIRGIGKPELEMKIIVSLTLFILIPGLYFGISFFGLIGAGYAVVFNKIGLAIIGLYVLNREIKVRIDQVFYALKGTFISIGVAGIAVVLIFTYSNITYFISIPLYFLIYFTLIFFLERKNIQSLLRSMN